MTRPEPDKAPAGRQAAAPPPAAGTYRTVREILGWTQEHFRKLGLPSWRLDAELLLAETLGVSRLELYTGHDRPVEPRERVTFREMVKRRSRREPVAYIIRRKEFFSLSFEVDPAVLVPRPETEHLVDAVLTALASRPRSPAEPAVPPRVLDLGTGSGNIAVAVAVHHPEVLVDAVDISAAALEVARRNARRHGVESRIRFHSGDLLAPLGEVAWDVIVSNPPYVRAREFEGLMPDVRIYEPREALVDVKSETSDGLGFYREIARSVASRLADNGSAIVEVGDGQAGDVAAVLRAAGLASIRTVRDLAGIERVVVGSRG